MIKRTHIRQFLAVVDAGTFTAAAARLNVTQPTLSLGVAELERLAGALLFVREKRRVRLTEAGARFLPLARRTEREFRGLDQFEGALAALPAPLLRMGTIRSVASARLRTLIATLAPHFRIDLIESTDAELRAALDAGRIDLALTLHRDGDVPLLPPEPYLLMVAQDHRLAASARIAPEDIAGETMIARRSCEILRETSQFFTARGIRPPFALRSDNDERCLALVAAGAGVTTAPASLASPGIVGVRLAGYDFVRRLGLIGEPGWLARHAAIVSDLAHACTAENSSS
ncbi:LysR family transcriptional regulator [Novosphingobium sp.]|uniref:LysR family transcriptional regulator n=1 Tax=Novosphingobium sp. TaxID=1874826 RepID=UPI0025F21CAF|nr:LysR family transcriptional regulator [Novosphingobium sp.]